MKTFETRIIIKLKLATIFIETEQKLEKQEVPTITSSAFPNISSPSGCKIQSLTNYYFEAAGITPSIRDKIFFSTCEVYQHFNNLEYIFLLELDFLKLVYFLLFQNKLNIHCETLVCFIYYLKQMTSLYLILIGIK